MPESEVMAESDFIEMMAEREHAWLIHDGRLDARTEAELDPEP